MVEAHLPRHAPGLARFVVNGTASKAFELPIGSVLVPAACLLGVGQNVALRPLRNGKLDPASWPRDGAIKMRLKHRPSLCLRAPRPPRHLARLVRET